MQAVFTSLTLSIAVGHAIADRLVDKKLWSFYAQPSLQGVAIDAQDPLKFGFFIDPGQGLAAIQDRDQMFQTMVQDFFIALAVPEYDLWVNLSPFERDRLIGESLRHHEMGYDLLRMDYRLKQLSGQLLDPRTDSGESYWDAYYERLQSDSQTDIVATSAKIANKVWVVPQQAVVLNRGLSGHIRLSTLAVMMEEDYLTLSKHPKTTDNSQASFDTAQKLFAKRVLPEIDHHINHSPQFQRLRQIHRALILVSWFKKVHPQHPLNREYTGQRKLQGFIRLPDQQFSHVYDQYQDSYHNGVFEIVQERFHPGRGMIEQYVLTSGGMNFSPSKVVKIVTDLKVDDLETAFKSLKVDVALNPVSESYAQSDFKSSNFAQSEDALLSEELLKIAWNDALRKDDIVNEVTVHQGHFDHVLPGLEIFLIEQGWIHLISDDRLALTVEALNFMNRQTLAEMFGQKVFDENAALKGFLQNEFKALLFKSMRAVVEETENMSLIDLLTQLLNRSGLDTYMNVLGLYNGTSDVDGQGRRRVPTGVLVLQLDLDKFGSINDVFGHKVGDEVLKGVAQIIRDSTTGLDITVRYGGEELIIFATFTPWKTITVDMVKTFLTSKSLAIDDHFTKIWGQLKTTPGIREVNDQTLSVDDNDSLLFDPEKTLTSNKLLNDLIDYIRPNERRQDDRPFRDVLRMMRNIHLSLQETHRELFPSLNDPNVIKQGLNNVKNIYIDAGLAAIKAKEEQKQSLKNSLADSNQTFADALSQWFSKNENDAISQFKDAGAAALNKISPGLKHQLVMQMTVDQFNDMLKKYKLDTDPYHMPDTGQSITQERRFRDIKRDVFKEMNVDDIITLSEQILTRWVPTTSMGSLIAEGQFDSWEDFHKKNIENSESPLQKSKEQRNTVTIDGFTVAETQAWIDRAALTITFDDWHRYRLGRIDDLFAFAQEWVWVNDKGVIDLPDERNSDKEGILETFGGIKDLLADNMAYTKEQLIAASDNQIRDYFNELDVQGNGIQLSENYLVELKDKTYVSELDVIVRGQARRYDQLARQRVLEIDPDENDIKTKTFLLDIVLPAFENSSDHSLLDELLKILDELELVKVIDQKIFLTMSFLYDREQVDAVDKKIAEDLKDHKPRMTSIWQSLKQDFEMAAIEHWHDMQKTLSGRAVYDKLTGFMNQRGFEVMGKIFITKPENDRRHQFALWFFDPDHFKVINEKDGHPVGDEALIIISEAVKETLAMDRFRGFVARVGGEEFVVILRFHTPSIINDFIQTVQTKIREKSRKIQTFQDTVAQRLKLSFYGGVKGVVDFKSVVESKLKTNNGDSSADNIKSVSNAVIEKLIEEEFMISAWTVNRSRLKEDLDRIDSFDMDKNRAERIKQLADTMLSQPNIVGFGDVPLSEDQFQKLLSDNVTINHDEWLQINQWIIDHEWFQKAYFFTQPFDDAFKQYNKNANSVIDTWADFPIGSQDVFKVYADHRSFLNRTRDEAQAFRYKIIDALSQQVRLNGYDETENMTDMVDHPLFIKLFADDYRQYMTKKFSFVKDESVIDVMIELDKYNNPEENDDIAELLIRLIDNVVTKALLLTPDGLSVRTFEALDIEKIMNSFKDLSDDDKILEFMGLTRDEAEEETITKIIADWNKYMKDQSFVALIEANLILYIKYVITELTDSVSLWQRYINSFLNAFTLVDEWILTSSGGVSFVDQAIDPYTGSINLSQFRKNSDTALYRAKADGRDRHYVAVNGVFPNSSEVNVTNEKILKLPTEQNGHINAQDVLSITTPQGITTGFRNDESTVVQSGMSFKDYVIQSQNLRNILRQLNLADPDQLERIITFFKDKNWINDTGAMNLKFWDDLDIQMKEWKSIGQSLNPLDRYTELFIKIVRESDVSDSKQEIRFLPQTIDPNESDGGQGFEFQTARKLLQMISLVSGMEVIYYTVPSAFSDEQSDNDNPTTSSSSGSNNNGGLGNGSDNETNNEENNDGKNADFTTNIDNPLNVPSADTNVGGIDFESIMRSMELETDMSQFEDLPVYHHNITLPNGITPVVRPIFKN